MEWVLIALVIFCCYQFSENAMLKKKIDDINEYEINQLNKKIDAIEQEINRLSDKII